MSTSSPRALTKENLGIGEGLPLEASDGGIEELRKDVQRLMDMEAVRQTKHTYFRCIDTANFEELASVLHTNLAVHYTGGDYEFKLDNRDDFVAVMRQSFSNQSVGRHIGSMPEIQMISETEATGIWYLYDHFWSINGKRLTHGTSLYWDRYVKEDGRWLIRETSYQRIYQMNEHLEKMPEFVAHYLATHGTDLG